MPAIYDRIEEDIIAQESRLWTALTSANPVPELEKLCDPRAKLLFPKRPIVSVESLEEAFQKPFHRFDAYDLNEVQVIVVDLMAGSITYRIRANRGNSRYDALGSTTWGQGSDGEWRIIVHQESLL